MTDKTATKKGRGRPPKEGGAMANYVIRLPRDAIEQIRAGNLLAEVREAILAFLEKRSHKPAVKKHKAATQPEAARPKTGRRTK